MKRKPHNSPSTSDKIINNKKKQTKNHRLMFQKEIIYKDFNFSSNSIILNGSFLYNFFFNTQVENVKR
jgi:hypothetical protein